MMMYPDQHTPPFNSPCQQHTSRPSSLLQSSYPSPEVQESRVNYPHVHGLGLFDGTHTLPIRLPPSPQPSESWSGHYSTGASPLMSEALANPEALADPWVSGAYSHPVSPSPLPWTSSQASPRPSLSSHTREMSVFSHDDSKHVYPEVRVESSPWGSEVHFNADRSAEMGGFSRQSALTVAPDRFNTTMFSYNNAATSPPFPRYDIAPVYDHRDRNAGRGPSQERINGPGFRVDRYQYPAIPANRKQARCRRRRDPARDKFRCELCPKQSFCRKYNLDQHMLTHDVYRKKEHVCQSEGCGRPFVRKTDLNRHIDTVHKKTKKFKCERCSRAFARKDTLSR
jgi:hypothetical protein